VTPKLVEAGGARFLLREWGERRARPLLFWHGLGATGAELEPVGPLLAGEYGLRVLAPDAPGLGASPPLGREGYASEASAEQAAALLDALEAVPAVFLGHSWGATVGCYLASQQRELVDSLVLLDGGYLDLGDLPWASEPPSYDELVALVRTRQEWANLETTTPEVWAAVVEAGFRQPPSAALERIPRDLPVLVVAATEPPEMEAVRQERLERFRAAVPQADVRRLPGVSHNLLAEAPERVARLVGDWLRQH
jgi:pimeloyl-ACP methyl ester carboxylesterase